jgi:hypothetical protein
MGFFGYQVGNLIWLPLLVVFAASLLLRRSWEPVRRLLAGLWADWTLLPFALYILFGWVYMVADENHHPYLLLFIAFTTLALSLGAWGYFRAGTPMRRVLALLGGLLLAVLLSTLNEATWDYRAYYGLPPGPQEVSLVGLVLFLILAFLMLGIGLLARWRLDRRAQHAMKG